MESIEVVDESEGSTEVLREEFSERSSEGNSLIEAMRLLSFLEKENQLYYMSVAGMVWAELNGDENEFLISLLSAFSDENLNSFSSTVKSGVVDLSKENFERDDVLKVAYATVVVRFRRYGLKEDSSRLHQLYVKMRERNLI